MTRKDYVMLAGAIADILDTLQDGTLEKYGYKELARTLQVDNHLFDESKFCAAFNKRLDIIRSVVPRWT